MYLKSIKTGFLVAVTLIGCVAGAHAQDSTTPEKRALIKELLEITGGAKGVDAFMEAFITQQEKDLPNVFGQVASPTDNLTREERAELDSQIKESGLRIIRRMREVFQRMNYGQLVLDLAMPVFEKHFSEPDLREWIAFYKTPVGKKSIEVLPVLMMEMMTKVSDTLGPKIQEEMNMIIADETAQLAQHAKSVPAPRRTTRTRKRSRH